MVSDDIGTTDGSVIYFNTPSQSAQRLFFYPIHLGHFFCDRTYLVDRSSFNSYLLMFIREGNGFVESGGKKYRLSAGDFLLLDCYRPHKYYTTTGWETYWVHFDGSVSRKLFEYATQNSLIAKPVNTGRILQSMNVLLEIFEKELPKNEAYLSKCLYDLITEYITASGNTEGLDNPLISTATKYISGHLEEDIPLEELADRCQVSPFYFSRIFKSSTGYTPHQYIINMRMNYACHLLAHTNLLVKEITYRCGFHNVSNFCTAFKKQYGITPKEFRSQ